MAKDKPGKKVTEEELLDYYVNAMLEDEEIAKTGYKREIMKIITEFKYGEGHYHMLLPINWNKLYNENSCPLCNELISLKESVYTCGECGLDIPVELYEKGKIQYDSHIESMKKRSKFTKRLDESGMSEEQIEKVYLKAIDKLDMMEVEEKQEDE